MPLYEHGPSGERKRTVPGRYEDQRVDADPAWTKVEVTEDEPDDPQSAAGYPPAGEKGASVSVGSQKPPEPKRTGRDANTDPVRGDV